MSSMIHSVHNNAVSASESTFQKHVLPHAESTNPDDFYMSASTRKIVYVSLVATAVFLASVGAYVWYGFTQWQNIW
jgi:hypothetical protein